MECRDDHDTCGPCPQSGCSSPHGKQCHQETARPQLVCAVTKAAENKDICVDTQHLEKCLEGGKGTPRKRNKHRKLRRGAQVMVC